jgi:DNA helicase HerA-like ATPase
MLQIADDFSIPIEAVTQTFAILAKRGRGKTYTACVIVEEMLDAGQHVVVVDPVGVWWGLRSSADGKGPGLPIVIMGGDHADVPLEATAGKLVASVIVEQRVSAVLDLSGFSRAEQTRFMTDFAEVLYRTNREPLHVVLDEADQWAPQQPVPESRRMLGAVEKIVRMGRAHGLGVTLITQRPAVLNKNVLTQTEILVTLQMTGPQDRKAIKEWVSAMVRRNKAGN